MEYRTKALSFDVYPQAKKFFGIHVDTYKWILDQIVVMATGKLMQMGIQSVNPMNKPFNAVVTVNGNTLWTGITFAAASVGQTGLITINKMNFGHDAGFSEKNEIRKQFTEVSSNELGWSGHFMVFHTELSSDQLILIDSLLKEFPESSDSAYQALRNRTDGANPEGLIIANLWNSAQEFAHEFEGELNIMNINPIFQARDLAVDEKQIFYALEFNDTRLGIFNVVKTSLESAFGVTVFKSGSIINPDQQSIMENIWIGINTANFVIVDISEKNPNVFYELGICHAIGKPTMVLCDRDSYKNDFNEKLPFDIHGIGTVFYDNSVTGADDLRHQVNAYADAFIHHRSVVL